jgi:hypothetical protein
MTAFTATATGEICPLFCSGFNAFAVMNFPDF